MKDDFIFAAEDALAPLKTFQRRTVDYVFQRLYTDAHPTRQFLVADEVGLGKTMVARGVIARTIEHLWDRVERIDVLYICSNLAIAQQNINRLNVSPELSKALPTRMTLIPLRTRGSQSLSANKVNFISLTPGTTFDLRSSTGVAEERALLLRLLEPCVSSPTGLYNMLQVSSGCVGWARTAEGVRLEDVDERIASRFREDVTNAGALMAEVEEVCALFMPWRESYPSDVTRRRSALVGRLRSVLSHACVDALEPDLIIMDEFQRFRDLLHGDHEAALLARELFDYRDADGNEARTLLLSATPYRMLTLAGDDQEEGEHYRDFMETLAYLYGREKGRAVADRLEEEIAGFRKALQGLPHTRTGAVEGRMRVEGRLRQVIARTERVGSTAERDSMVRDLTLPVSVAPEDLRQAAAIAAAARLLDAPGIVEYWKSAPYLLNFMRDYALKRALAAAVDSPPPGLADAVRRARQASLCRESLHAYQPLVPPNGRFRALMDDLFGDGLDQHLWIPPSLPYYGPAPDKAPPTKALVFSAWSMVPDAIAALMSYEAERRMGVGETGQRYFADHRVRPLQFRRADGRLAGMRAMLLIHPSPTLARAVDPLALLADGPERPSYEAARRRIRDALSPLLDCLRPLQGQETDGSGWEWAAVPALDRLADDLDLDAWFAEAEGMVALAEDDAFRDHVREFAGAADRDDLGPLPDGLADLLTDVALGSPAVCALRTLKRLAPELAWDDPHLLAAAAGIAWGFRVLFNQHDAIALVRRGEGDRYWHQVLGFCFAGNLQAVLDEYGHYLLDAEGLAGHPPDQRVAGLAEAMTRALSLRPSQIDVDDVQVDGEGLRLEKFAMRGRFAMRLADYRDEEGSAERLSGVRDAFNSPFRPFVLASTSIGQEGLDFHPYCYRLYHWNLPSNPVDLEQREGRVHRFKGHAVRLNVASQYGAEVAGQAATLRDPWAALFVLARERAPVDNDLVPYWVCDGPVKVERRVPLLPYSRDIRRLEWLKRSLTVYRLAFGQPRQDDLLEYLQKMAEAGLSASDIEDLQIRLEPRSGSTTVSSAPAGRWPPSTACR